jgi:hypothetical protein
MTYEEALTVTQMVITTWPSTKVWGEEEMDAYAHGLQRYEASACVKAVAAAQQKLMYRPSVAELREFYDIERAKTRAAAEAPERQWPTKRETVPLWVRRWVAARYLYARFGKEQDLRPFREQGDWATPDGERMPQDAWLEEAEHVTDDRVWNTLRG